MPELPPRVLALRRRINDALPCTVLHCSREDVEAVEDFLSALQAERFAEWQAAGQPEDWDQPLGLLFTGPHGGVFFKGVELLIAEPVT